MRKSRQDMPGEAIAWSRTQRGVSNSRDQSSSLMYSGLTIKHFTSLRRPNCSVWNQGRRTVKILTLNVEENFWKTTANQSKSNFAHLWIPVQFQIHGQQEFWSFKTTKYCPIIFGTKKSIIISAKALSRGDQEGWSRDSETVVTTRPVGLALTPLLPVWFNHGGPGNANPDPGHMGQPTSRWGRSQEANVLVRYAW